VPRSERNRGGRPRTRLILSSNGRESSKTFVAVETFLRSVSVGDVHVPCPDCSAHYSRAARTGSGPLRTLCGPRPEVEALRISINFAAVQPPSRRLRTCGRLHVSVVRLRRPRRWAGSLDPRNHHSVSARVHFAVQTDRTDDGCVLAAIVKQRAGPRLVRAANRLSHVEPRISLRLGKMWSRKKKRCVLGQVRNKKRPTPNCSERR